MAMKKRLFIAIEIPEKITEKIVKLQKELKKTIEAKWVKPDNIHLTLIFLGQIAEEKITSVEGALKSLKFNQFNLRARGLGGFPNLKHPHVLWIGIDESVELSKIQENLFNSLRSKGFRIEDRKFSGHLTLARVRSKIDSSSLIKNKNLDFGEIKVKKIVLCESELKPEGPKHQKCFEIELKPEKN